MPSVIDSPHLGMVTGWIGVGHQPRPATSRTAASIFSGDGM